MNHGAVIDDLNDYRSVLMADLELLFKSGGRDSTLFLKLARIIYLTDELIHYLEELDAEK